ncbi:sclerostin domain-containing protein 1-like [Saccostrea echinata]|uniref:sclerostin domain-containing protein 1-like n=1 Tax=Saccostrea echinata TaxID=191078 RepID=UPI002A839F9E|nr:sclerostin domain-containing protein 1-like [Saccostrea echinata]
MRILRSDTLVFVICAFVSVFKCILSFSDLSNKENNMDHKSMNSSDSHKMETYFKQIYPNADDVLVQCKALRSQRYFSDGNCYSTKPIIEDVCVGSCVPMKELQVQWWSEFVKYWSNNKQKEYRCVNDKVKRKKIQLICKDGTIRTRTVKVVKSCKCKIVNKKRKNRRGRRRNRKNRSKSKRHLRNRNKIRRNRRRLFQYNNMKT